MLHQGHTVEFFAIEGFVRPDELFGLPGFSYHPVRVAWVAPGLRWIETHVPAWARRGVDVGFNDAQRHAHERAIANRIEARHRERRYDALLVVDRLSPFSVPGLRCVSWTQGPPDAELDAIRRLPQVVKESVGFPFYAALRAYYPYRVGREALAVHHSDAIVCGSRWAASRWGRWVSSERVTPLPFPVDLELFRPRMSEETKGGGPTFLWLGRIVPRKRLDLVVEAMTIVLRQMPSARLLVVGSVAYGDRILTRLREPTIAHAIEHRERIARAEVPNLLHSVDVLVQPSENENFGTSVAEALACGLPVVLGPTNGTADYAGEAGYLCDRYAADAVADAMLRAARDLACDEKGVARAARRAAERNLDVDRVIEKLTRLLGGQPS